MFHRKMHEEWKIEFKHKCAIDVRWARGFWQHVSKKEERETEQNWLCVWYECATEPGTWNGKKSYAVTLKWKEAKHIHKKIQ